LNDSSFSFLILTLMGRCSRIYLVFRVLSCCGPTWCERWAYH